MRQGRSITLDQASPSGIANAVKASQSEDANIPRPPTPSLAAMACKQRGRIAATLAAHATVECGYQQIGEHLNMHFSAVGGGREERTAAPDATAPAPFPARRSPVRNLPKRFETRALQKRWDGRQDPAHVMGVQDQASRPGLRPRRGRSAIRVGANTAAMGAARATPKPPKFRS